MSIWAVVSVSEAASAQGILPPHPDAPGGGNPIQGLGRSDDPYPARYKDFVQPPEKSSGSQEGESESQSTESSDAEKSGEKPIGEAPTAADLDKALGEKSGEPSGSEPPHEKGQPRLPTAKDLEKLREVLEKQSRGGQTHLVPPPPPIAGPQATSSTPERTALALIKVGHFTEAETKLRELVLNEPNNMHARYLLAVTLVHSRKFQEAKSEYAHVVQNSRNPNLVQLAQAGIDKLK